MESRMAHGMLGYGCKIFGKSFDIHGGGMDLLFPHHESEIAQSMAANGIQLVKYWLHNNMITINGQKMGKSLGNFITLEEFFTVTIICLNSLFAYDNKIFHFTAHYRGTVDFSNAALQASGKAYERLMKAFDRLDNITTGSAGDFDVNKLSNECYDAMNDDFNTPMAIAALFDAVKFINAVADKQASMSAEQKTSLLKLKKDFIHDILGLKQEDEEGASAKGIEEELMKLIIDLRLKFRQEKNFEMSDFIRDELKKSGVELKDTKEGTTWNKN